MKTEPRVITDLEPHNITRYDAPPSELTHLHDEGFHHGQSSNVPTDESGRLDQLKNESIRAVHDVRDTVVNRSKDVAHRTGEMVKSKADKAVNQASEKVRNLSRALQDAGERLDGEQPQKAVNLTNRAAGRIDRVADYLDRKDSREVADDFRSVVREHPALTLATCALAGLAVGRFLKAGAPTSPNV